MRCPKLILACAALLIGTASVQADTMPQAGQDNKLEWQVVKNWQTDGQPVDLVHSLDGKLVFILNNLHQVLVYDAAGVLQGRVPVAEGVTAIDIAPQGEALHLIDSKTNTFSTLAMNFVYDIDIAGSPVKGKTDAPVTITIFTDFECPYCIKLEPLLNQVVEKNKDNVKLVFKNFPLQFHPMADPSHRAALAAGEQGKFWEFHDRLFAAEKLSPELIDTIAKELGLDIARFKKDMESPEVRQKISKDMADAEKASVTGTPTVFINGRKLQQRSPEGFQQVIDEELKKKGK
jgi:protein-disulfide isomerase